MVARGDIVAAHQHQVPNAEGRRAKKVGLEGEAVAIAHRQLHDRLQTFLHQEMGRCQ